MTGRPVILYNAWPKRQTFYRMPEHFRIGLINESLVRPWFQYVWHIGEFFRINIGWFAGVGTILPAQCWTNFCSITNSNRMSTICFEDRPIVLHVPRGGATCVGLDNLWKAWVLLGTTCPHKKRYSWKPLGVAYPPPPLVPARVCYVVFRRVTTTGDTGDRSPVTFWLLCTIQVVSGAALHVVPSNFRLVVTRLVVLYSRSITIRTKPHLFRVHFIEM